MPKLKTKVKSFEVNDKGTIVAIQIINKSLLLDAGEEHGRKI